MTQNDPSDKWLKHTLQQAPWRAQTQTTSLVLAVVVMVVVIGALYLAQASRTAGTGRRLQALEAERQRLEQENAQLRAEIAAQRSVPRLISEAQALGYHLATSPEVEYLTIEDIPPAPAPTATPLPAAEEIVPRYDESLEGWLADQLVNVRTQIDGFWARAFGGDDAEEPEDAPIATPTSIPEKLFEPFPELAPTAVPTNTPEPTYTPAPTEDAAEEGE